MKQMFTKNQNGLVSSIRDPESHKKLDEIDIAVLLFTLKSFPKDGQARKRQRSSELTLSGYLYQSESLLSAS